ARREEACPPTTWARSGRAGFGNEAHPRGVGRQLWTMWTLGQPSADQRRVASVLLAQEAPIVVRVAVAPSALTAAERDGIEALLMTVGPELRGDGLARASLHTLESLLYLRPVFDTRCVVASTEPISR